MQEKKYSYLLSQSRHLFAITNVLLATLEISDPSKLYFIHILLMTNWG